LRERERERERLRNISSETMEILYDEKNRGYNRAIRYLVVTYDLKNQEKLKCTPSISIDNE